MLLPHWWCKKANLLQISLCWLWGKFPAAWISSIIPAVVTDIVWTINFKQQEVPKLFSLTPLLFIHRDESQAFSLPCQGLWGIIPEHIYSNRMYSRYTLWMTHLSPKSSQCFCPLTFCNFLVVMCAFVAKEWDYSGSALPFSKTNFIVNTGLPLNLWNSCRMESLSY